MAVAVASLQVQVIIMPPSHSAMVMVHRGIIIMFMAGGLIMAPGIIPEAIDPMPARSIIVIIILIHPW
jgi:hypothetical protein